MPFQTKPISFKPARLKGLTPRLIASHYENNYGGAVRRLNAIRAELAAADPAAIPPFRLNGLKREELIATNSMLLHEAYFEAMGEGGGGDPSGALADAMTRDFGSVAKWRAEFVALAKALRGGSGWVLLTRSPRDGTLCNVWSADHTHTMAGGTVVLALDMYEHSYALDFGANADGYVDAFMANIAWERIANRFTGSAPATKPHMVDTLAARRLIEGDQTIIVIDALPRSTPWPHRCPRAPRPSCTAPGASRSAAIAPPGCASAASMPSRSRAALAPGGPTACRPNP